jgi:putative spermidine/putrescine transport system permease protein
MQAYMTRSGAFFHFGLRTFVVLVMIFLIVPVFVIVPLSFTSGASLNFPLPGWSMRWYEDFFTNPLWTEAVRNSVFIATVTTILATILGTTAALGLNGLHSRLKPLFLGVLVTPMVVPIVITAVAMYFLFSMLGLVGTATAMILGHTVIAIPYVVITVSAALQGFDQNLPRAAAILGAPPIAVLRRVTLPLIWPGLLAGALFAFIASFDELVIALFLSSPALRTLPRQIFSGVSESISPTVAAAAVVLMGVSVSLMLCVQLLRHQTQRLTLARQAAS